MRLRLRQRRDLAPPWVPPVQLVNHQGLGEERVGAHEALPPAARTPVPIGGPARCEGREHGSLSNLALCRMYIEGKYWASVEQYYQAAQFSDVEHREAICQVPGDAGNSTRFASLVHGAQVWRLGQSREHARVPEFRALETMYVASRAKFEQNFAFRDQLLRTSARIEGAPNNGEWQRLHGMILERIRAELRETPDEAHLLAVRALFAAEGFDEEAVASRCKAIAEDHHALGQQHCFQLMMLDGRSVGVSALGADSIRHLKEQLAQSNGVSMCRVELIFDGVKLTNGQTVAGVGLTNGCIVNVIIRSPIPTAAQSRDADAHADLMALIRERQERSC